jgi:ADP-ribosylglycohydrolase/fructose-1,6-bisphosphatase/inositol monophosphatase family enzyme
MTDLAALLEPVCTVVREAGAQLAAEFHRPGGPRGRGDTAEIDLPLEQMLRAALLELAPVRFVGEESGSNDIESDLCWLVDPHDGTRAFLQSHRGSSISVALLRDGLPVLGVVYAPLSPDRGPDMIAWAEGLPAPLRNGVPVPRLDERKLAPGEIVLLSQSAARRPIASARNVAPARFVPLPSIAYRLARVATADAVATVSISAPVGHDYAAGHALLRGAGGVLLNEAGQEVIYSREGRSAVTACFGGAPDAAEALAARDWKAVPVEIVSVERVAVPRPRHTGGLDLDRAVGCLLGQVIGDSLGSLVEFLTPSNIRRAYPDGVTDLRDGGTWNTFAGQPTDDSELALAMTRCVIATGNYEQEQVAAAYARWFASHPFDAGMTTGQALAAAVAAPDGERATAARQAASQDSQSNGSLMRTSPIGILAASPDEAALLATLDSQLTHPNPACTLACAATAAAIAAAIDGAMPEGMFEAAARVAGTRADGGAVLETLQRARDRTLPEDYTRKMGWVLLALQNAFFHLLHTDSVEQALIQTVARGGDTDTNAAITGALMGAAYGRQAFPARWVMPVLACRPLRELGAVHPRPMEYWPDDVPELAEALLTVRSASPKGQPLPA